MYRNLLRVCCLLFVLLLSHPLSLKASQAEETVVEFVTDHTILEDDPNRGVYNITIYSLDGLWKIQLNYHANSMFGTFTNEDFQLDGTGKYYNYARNPNNDMVFYSFTDMNVSVTDEGTLYRVHANCLANNNTRFLVEATIAAPKPTSTVTDHLGYAHITTNSFYGTYVFKAENERFKLAYGIVSEELLGTFYRADILMPELTDKQTGKRIEVTSATAVHTQSADTMLLHIDLVSNDLVLYSLSMFNTPSYQVEITGEQDIAILSDVVLQDLSQMYGCYQFGGQNDEYGVAIAVTPEAFESGRTEWDADDIFLPYTTILRLCDNTTVDIFGAKAALCQEDNAWWLKADVTAMDGILYHVSMNLKGGSTPPVASDTVNIDFGAVAVLDYTKGIGTIGLGGIVPGKFQMRAYLNAYNLEGSFGNDNFLMEMCDVMVVNEQQGTYVFHDAKYVSASFEVIDGVTYVTIDMVGVDDVLYHATMHIDPMDCLHDMQVPIDFESEVMMVAFQEGVEADYAEYTLQLQDIEEVYDEDYNIVGDGYAVSFYFAHDGNASIAGEYGYSAGTLAEDECHTFFENGCEVRIAPVAGTLSIEAVEEVTVGFDSETIDTWLYSIKFQFLGQNGAIYSAEGNNFLLCLDNDGNWLEMDESATSIFVSSLEQQGLKVRKALRNGKFIIERSDRSYSLQGCKAE